MNIHKRSNREILERVADDFPPSSYQRPGRELDKSLMRFELSDEEAHTYIACMQRLRQVCAPESSSEGLLARLDDNRKF